jgi:PDZ domain-containing protein
VFLVCLAAVPLPLIALVPAPPQDVFPLIDIQGVETFDPDGRLLLTTVYTPLVDAYQAVRGWLDPKVDVLPERLFLPPGVTEAEYGRVSLSQMDASKIAAASAALRRTTEYPHDHGSGALVQDVVGDSPADGKLFSGDLVVEADGLRVDGLGDLVAAIHRAGVGGPLDLTVEPVEGGVRRQVHLRPAEAPEGNRPVIGVRLVPNFPFEVVINSGNIGGPSAGLMWALGIADLLTSEDLTDGRTLAGTGAIDPAGHVFPIGGVREKVVAAEEAGAEAFLVPSDNLDEAESAPVDLELVPVGTLSDAVEYLSPA